MVFRHFLEKIQREIRERLTRHVEATFDAAVNYPWPGNLRELENFVKPLRDSGRYEGASANYLKCQRAAANVPASGSPPSARAGLKKP